MRHILVMLELAGLLAVALPQAPPLLVQAPPLPQVIIAQDPTYSEVRARALATGKLLIIFVRVEPIKIPGAMIYATTDFLGIREGVVVSVPYRGDLFHRGMLPWDADAADIQAEIESLRATLQAPKQATKKVSVNVHSHRCARCGHSWTHEDFNVGIRGPHMCPACGAGPNWPKTWSGQQTREIPLKTSFAPRRAAYCPT